MTIALGAGCSSSGFNRGALKEQIGVAKPVVTDGEIKDVLNRKPNLPKPFKLAVYFKPPVAPGNESLNQPWRWSEADKTALTQVATDLKNEKVISTVYPVLETLVDDHSLRGIRLAAAKMGADAVLIVEGAGQTDRYINGWGWTYALILPALFVRGTQTDTLFMVSASMWDVRNEYLYLTAEAEGQSHATSSPAGGETDEVLFDRARADAMARLKSQVVNSVQGK